MWLVNLLRSLETCLSFFSRLAFLRLKYLVGIAFFICSSLLIGLVYRSGEGRYYLPPTYL